MPTASSRSLFLIASLSLSTIARVAGAQTRTSLEVAAGATAPVATYADDKHLGFNAGLLLEVQRRGLPLSVRVDGMYHQLGYRHSSTSAEIWSATANLLAQLPMVPAIRPYAIVGAGIANARRNIIIATQASTRALWSVGGGVRVPGVAVPFFLEARYQREGNAPTDVRIVPVSLGIGF